MSVTLLTPEDIRGIVADTVSKTLAQAGYIHKDALLDTMEAAKVLGLDIDKKGTIMQAMNRFTTKYDPPLKRVKIGTTKYRYSDLQEFIQNHML